MKVNKIKKRVNIACSDNSIVKGIIHLNEGERILDFLNDEKEVFLAVTRAEFSNLTEVRSFKLYAELIKKDRDVVFLNKSSIKWVEEV